MDIWIAVTMGTLALLAIAAGTTAVTFRSNAAKAQAKLEEDLGKAQQSLKDFQSSQAQVIHTTKLASLSKMVAGLAHEVNTPLGYVTSNAEVIAEMLDEHAVALKRCSTPLVAIAERAPDDLKRHLTPGDEHPLAEIQELVVDMQDGLSQIANLVEDLRSFSRVDRDGEDDLDINEGLQASLKMAKHAMEPGIEIKTQLADLPPLRCIPSQMQQVFLNLINNAAQAMGSQGTLTLATKLKSDHIEVTVKDTGCGIADEHLPRIFDPFYTTKDVGDGTGLGLSVVYRIVKAYQGNIDVQTQPGKGTSFIITFPVEAQAQAA